MEQFHNQKKIKLILKFITLQPGKQTIAIHFFPNVSRSKVNQTMKFDQLIGYKIRNFFFEKSYTKCDGIFSVPFIKN